jgi:hypothetical protein
MPEADPVPADPVPDPVPEAPRPGAPASEVQFMLTLTLAPPGTGAWHARVQLPDRTVRDFSSPFELVRYLSCPALPERRRGRSGLR